MGHQALVSNGSSSSSSLVTALLSTGLLPTGLLSAGLLSTVLMSKEEARHQSKVLSKLWTTPWSTLLAKVFPRSSSGDTQPYQGRWLQAGTEAETAVRVSVGEGETPSVPELLGEVVTTVPNREPLRVLLVGSRRGVNNTILTLYRLGFAQVSEWSPLLPAPTAGEVMSILTRYIQLDP